MTGAGILEGEIVVVLVDGKVTVKQLHRRPYGDVELRPENPRGCSVTCSAGRS